MILLKKFFFPADSAKPEYGYNFRKPYEFIFRWLENILNCFVDKGREHLSISLSTAQSCSLGTEPKWGRDYFYASPIVYVRTIFPTSLPSLNIVRF